MASDAMDSAKPKSYDARTRRAWRPGPGLLITAAFIGPGTIVTASRAGAEFGFALLWAIVFAVSATIVLQEMAARLGLVTGHGLSEAIRQSIQPTWARNLSLALVIVAIVVGNMAYQTGNLIGGSLGAAVLLNVPANTIATAVGVSVTFLLALGVNGRSLKNVLIGIVLAMSAAIIAAATLSRPDPSALVAGLLPTLPAGSALTAIALIGTTVVPYNLFLHATAASQRWPTTTNTAAALRSARLDTVFSVGLGGIVTMALMITAASAFFGIDTPTLNATTICEQLRPMLGSMGQGLFAAGLAAAGLTSAVTAPLAAGYAAAGCMSPADEPARSRQIARATATLVAALGTLLAWLFGRSPSETIVVAQAANGLLLPLVAIFLLWMVNRKDLLDRYTNGWWLNVLGLLVVLVSFGLGAKKLWAAMS